MLHSNRTIIPGPPGTGKTYSLVNHHLANELKTVAPDKILYVYEIMNNQKTWGLLLTRKIFYLFIIVCKVISGCNFILF